MVELAKVICNVEMLYNSIKRYKGEVFELVGARNDDKLVRVGHVRPVTGDMEPLKGIERDDATGRIFVDRAAWEAYRRAAPADAVIVQRRAGRPVGAKDSAPRQRRSKAAEA